MTSFNITAFKQQLIQIMLETGPMPLDRYMAECLSHPVHGYYIKQDPFGAHGDFTTAPEISQMFGELIGLWIGDLWTRQGKPKNPGLIELGPGRGTLMADIQRALAKVTGWPKDAPIRFIETSPALRKAQEKRHPSATWYRDFGSLPRRGPAYIIANELFDALPIKQFEKTSNGWRERYVVPAGTQLALAALETGPDVSPLIPQEFKHAPTGSVLELCPLGRTIAEQMGHYVTQKGGAALMIDYGYESASLGDSFQAVADHSYVSPLDAPGNADLTAHVDFGMLTASGQSAGCDVYGPVTQGSFLNGLGLGIRAKSLGQSAMEDAKRLADPGQMGTLFKAIAFAPKGSVPPAGFPLA